jgi:hypothetical protein
VSGPARRRADRTPVTTPPGARRAMGRSRNSAPRAGDGVMTWFGSVRSWHGARRRRPSIRSPVASRRRGPLPPSPVDRP